MPCDAQTAPGFTRRRRRCYNRRGRPERHSPQISEPVGLSDLRRECHRWRAWSFGLPSPPASTDIVSPGGTTLRRAGKALYGDVPGCSATGKMRGRFTRAGRGPDRDVAGGRVQSLRHERLVVQPSMSARSVFLPLGSPTADFYCRRSSLNNLYGNRSSRWMRRPQGKCYHISCIPISGTTTPRRPR